MHSGTTTTVLRNSENCWGDENENCNYYRYYRRLYPAFGGIADLENSGARMCWVPTG